MSVLTVREAHIGKVLWPNRKSTNLLKRDLQERLQKIYQMYTKIINVLSLNGFGILV